MAKAYLVIRIKGQADVPYWANTTLRLLKLEKKYRATILPIKENTEGMLKKIQHFVSWQEIDMSTTKELLDKKGRRLLLKIFQRLVLKQLMNLQHLYPKGK